MGSVALVWRMVLAGRCRTAMGGSRVSRGLGTAERQPVIVRTVKSGNTTSHSRDNLRILLIVLLLAVWNGKYDP
jgi:hypothetical protein